jgi:4-amino-4-deoxy-L-arabinose transferase-like glycosyltransferase
LALAVRLAIAALGWSLTPGGPLVREPDSPSYIRAAEALVRMKSFGPPGHPEVIRTPGYPLLLTLGVWLGPLDAVTTILQSALGCLTAWLVYRIGLLVLGRADWALAGALVYACEPLSALYCSKLLSETLFTAAITAAMLLALRYVARQSAIDLCASAVVVAISAFVRPIAYFLPLAIVGLYVAWLWNSSESKKLLLLKSLGFLLLAFGPLALWQARNYAVAGYPRFSAISDINLYFYQAAGTLALERGAPIGEVQRELGYGSEEVYLRSHPEQRSWSQAERLQFQHDEAVRILREHPGAMLRMHLAGILDMLIDPGTNAYLDFFRLRDDERQAPPRQADASIVARLRRAFRDKPLAATIHVLLYGALFGIYAAAILGALVSRVWNNRLALFALAIAGYLLALSGGPAAYHRLRLPLEPVICLLAGCGLAALWEFLRAWRCKFAR